jgi:hypothetical protein
VGNGGEVEPRGEACGGGKLLIILLKLSCITTKGGSLIPDTSAGGAFPIAEALEGRTLLSFVPVLPDFPEPPDLPPTQFVRARTWNAGDFYWYFDKKVRLLRATNAFVVGVKPGVKAGMLSRSLLNGPLEGFEKVESLNADSLRFVADEGLGKHEYNQVQRELRAMKRVAWTSPAFMGRENKRYLWITDEVVMQLSPQTDAQGFLSERFSNFRVVGPEKQFMVTIPRGGVTALRVADKLHADSNVVWSSPNLYQQAIPF